MRLNILLLSTFFLLAPLPAAAEEMFMEEMTWPEIKAAMGSGSTTVLIPTGGTEQNGPHMVLGKHNYIVHYTAEKIASALGHTLIAPVVAYTPEGNIDPPDGHMRFPGTISIPEGTYAATLEAIARSLKQHGFKLICFLGDSGPNQLPQAQVAKELNEEWADDGVQVLQVGDYYSKNGQDEWLLAHGETEASIGTHAAIEDTSELMAINPNGIRENKRTTHATEDLNITGVNGDASRASVKLGKELLELKIIAAVKQIRAVRK